ncbi:hypothetical protein T484DRAFT_1825851, partial [Baffinella frigidus]
MFKVSIQAMIGVKIIASSSISAMRKSAVWRDSTIRVKMIASSSISAMRKDVPAKCY